MVEQYPLKVTVTGSNPVRLTYCAIIIKRYDYESEK